MVIKVLPKASSVDLVVLRNQCLNLLKKRPDKALIDPILALLAHMKLARSGQLTEAQDKALEYFETQLEHLLEECEKLNKEAKSSEA